MEIQECAYAFKKWKEKHFGNNNWKKRPNSNFQQKVVATTQVIFFFDTHNNVCIKKTT